MKNSSIFFDCSLVEPFFRLILAVFGGFIAARFCGTALAASIPLAQVDATALGILLAFVLFACAGIWVFAASSVWRALLGLAIPSVICAGLLLLQQGGAA